MTNQPYKTNLKDMICTDKCCQLGFCQGPSFYTSDIFSFTNVCLRIMLLNTTSGNIRVLQAFIFVWSVFDV